MSEPGGESNSSDGHVAPARSKRRRAKPKLVDQNELESLIDSLDLDSEQKRLIKARWLKYVIWWDHRSTSAKRRYQFLRGFVIAGGASLPALVALGERSTRWEGRFASGVIVVSFLVALCAALESFGRYGEIWREKRTADELIKSEGFEFFQLSGAYCRFKSHRAAFARFSCNVERIIRAEIEDYFEAVSQDDGTRGGTTTDGAPNPNVPDKESDNT